MIETNKQLENSQPKWISLEEASRRLNMSKEEICHLAGLGLIPWSTISGILNPTFIPSNFNDSSFDLDIIEWMKANPEQVEAVKKTLKQS